MESDLNPSVAAAVELLIAHGWKWVGRGLQPSLSRSKHASSPEITMHLLHSLLREEAHLL